jgi:hypothetical protein
MKCGPDMARAVRIVTGEHVGDDQGKLEMKTEGDCESGHPLDNGSIWFSIDWLGTTR